MGVSTCLPNGELRLEPRGSVKTKLRAMANLKSITVISALCVVLPILVVLASVLQPDAKVWRHIVETLLMDLLRNTIVLCVGVLAGTLILGVGTAWLTAVCDFPGRSFFNWALMLPLAVPTYVLAFVFIGLFDFSGPVQTLLRTSGVSTLPGLPNIRSAGGVILVMSLALYPYVYLLARNAFQTQGRRLLEVSRALRHGHTKSFFKASLPMARPWIAAGSMLVLMETLADFGAVSIFNYDTFTTGIYKAWFGFFSLAAAAQFSSVLLVFIFIIVAVEQQMRSRMQFHQVGGMSGQAGRIRLQGWKKWLAYAALGLVVSFAFFLPCLQLLAWSVDSMAVELDSRYLGLLARSLFFSSTAAVSITGLGLLMAYTQRRYTDGFTRWALRLSTMGYALPGTVLAVGIVILVNLVDKPIIWAIREALGIQMTSIFSGTILAVLFAYAVRFLTVGFNSVNSSMLRITRSVDEVSALLGVSGMKMIRRVHIPMLRSGILTAAIFVFVDVMKEMPITLMTRPFGWDTLAVKVFELTSEGEWRRAALPSLTLVLTGLIPLILLTRKAEQSTL